MLVDSRISVHVKCLQVESRVCLVLTMNIFMFSVSLLLVASHHVHFHHLYSIPPFPTALAGKLKGGWRYWSGTIHLETWKIRWFCGKTPHGCSSVCVPWAELPWAAGEPGRVGKPPHYYQESAESQLETLNGDVSPGSDCKTQKQPLCCRNF